MPALLVKIPSIKALTLAGIIFNQFRVFCITHPALGICLSGVCFELALSSGVSWIRLGRIELMAVYV